MSNRPFVKLVFPFVSGMFLAKFYPFEFLPQEVVLILFAAVFLLFVMAKILVRRPQGLVFPSLLVLLSVFVAGYGLYSFTDLQNKKTAGNLQNGILISRVTSIPHSTGKTVKVVMEVEAINHGGKWYESQGKIIVYFKDTTALKLVPGNRILMDVDLKDVEDAGNPEEFSYKKYLAFHFITKQAFLSAGKWKLLDEGNSVLDKSGRLRKKVIAVIDSSPMQARVKQVVKALTVGYKDDLDMSVRQKFSSTGAMHVLAVSGLHVGIIFIILNALLFPYRKLFKGMVIPSLIIILMLWLYAGITGFSPSVTRATLMFSLLQTGKMLKRDTDIFNTIAASAFIILLLNPFNINKLGFWLSYAAVTGIILLYPFFYKLVYINTTKKPLVVIDKIWSLIAVSLAAQIATFPITLYFFHNFPVYFLITNLIVIPLVPFIMYSALGMIVFSGWTPAYLLFAKSTDFLTSFMLDALSKIQAFPHHVITDISLSLPAFLLLILLVIFMSAYLVKGWRKMFLASLAVVLLMLVVNLYEYQKGQNRKIFVVYNIGGYTAANFIDGKDNIVVTSVKANENKLNYAAKNYWVKLGLNREKIIDVNKLDNRFLFSTFWVIDNPAFFFYNNYIKFYNLRLAFIDKNFSIRNVKPAKKLKLNYLVIRDNPKIKIAGLLNLYDFDKIIFDSSNSFYNVKKWKSDCQKLGVEYFDVKSQGAFIAKAE